MFYLDKSTVLYFMLQRAKEVLNDDKLVHELLQLAGGETVQFALAAAIASKHGADVAIATFGRGGMDCKFCGAKKTVHAHLAQVRSADEGETAFCCCSACLKTWSV